MNGLDKKIVDLRMLFSGIQSLTDSIDLDTVDQALETINHAKARIDITMGELKANYPPEVLKPYHQEFAVAAKQISKSFDNVITNHKNELTRIQVELAKLNSQKKISNYQR